MACASTGLWRRGRPTPTRFHFHSRLSRRIAIPSNVASRATRVWRPVRTSSASRRTSTAGRWHDPRPRGKTAPRTDTIPGSYRVSGGATPRLLRAPLRNRGTRHRRLSPVHRTLDSNHDSRLGRPYHYCRSRFGKTFCGSRPASTSTGPVFPFDTRIGFREWPRHRGWRYGRFFGRQG